MRSSSATKHWLTHWALASYEGTQRKDIFVLFLRASELIYIIWMGPFCAFFSYGSIRPLGTGRYPWVLYISIDKKKTIVSKATGSSACYKNTDLIWSCAIWLWFVLSRKLFGRTKSTERKKCALWTSVSRLCPRRWRWRFLITLHNTLLFYMIQSAGLPENR